MPKTLDKNHSTLCEPLGAGDRADVDRSARERPLSPFRRDRRRRASPRRLSVLVLGCIVLALLFPFFPNMARPVSEGRSFIPKNVPPTPHRILARSEELLPLSSEDQNWVCRQVQPPADGRLTPSLCVHLMHLHGLDKDVGAKSDSCCRPLLLDILLNEELGIRYFGHSVLLKTRYGVRVAPRSTSFSSEEAHRDQCLAGLAALGIPLSHPVFLRVGCASVRDLLNESIARFHLGQDELAWTAQAYALYLPPAHEWSNCFDERFTFDDLVEELLRTPVNEASCFGMHLIYSLTTIARVDGERQILSAHVRSQLLDRLRKLVSDCSRKQQPEGYWMFDWHREVAPYAAHPYAHSSVDTTYGRLLMTSHVAEWLLILPEDMQVSRKVQRRAAEWLITRLRRSNNIEQLVGFCPFTHAAYAVRHCANVSANHGGYERTPQEEEKKRKSPKRTF